MAERRNGWSEYFNPSSNDIPLLRLLSYGSVPTVKCCRFLGISPNQATFISMVLWGLAIFSLFQGLSITYVLLLFLSMSFDIADGVLARLANKKTRLGSFFDHFGDQLKMLALFVGIGALYNTLDIWLLCGFCAGGFPLLGYLGLLTQLRESELTKSGVKGPDSYSSPVVKEDIGFRAVITKLMLGTWRSVMLLQGNVIFHLSFLGFGLFWARVGFAILILVIVKSMVITSMRLIQILILIDDGEGL